MGRVAARPAVPARRLAPPRLDPELEGRRILEAVRAEHEQHPPRPGGRLFDLMVAVVAFVLLWPLFPMVALAIKLTSRGPVFFRHERIGLSGRPFDCLKFRTMVTDADKRLAELLADPQRAKDFAEKHKLTDDPRITRVGAFLRKSNLDELPQLLNVLRGEMSIVGPRPIVLSEVPRYGGAMSPVLRVRPGLTGLWQVSGRNDVTYAERVLLDLRYVNERSTKTDASICVRTVHETTRGNSGAY